MPKFKVTISKSLGMLDKPFGFNPFLVRDIFGGGMTTHSLRVFEMEVEDEAAVRSFFKQAQDADLENVRGYSLGSIELVVPCIYVSDCPDDYCGTGTSSNCPHYKAATI